MTIQGKKDTLKMSIHVGILESLGVNMYTSVGQSLVEFVANGYDANAKRVWIDIPFENIETARKSVRDAAKKQAKSNGESSPNGVYEPLSEDIKITIKDDGHGMNVTEIEDKFLVLSRNRRSGKDGAYSEGRKRKVMGRKGLGKLAGFGVAQKVQVTSKRKGDDYSTCVEMDFENIQKMESLGEVELPARYETGQPINEEGTTVVLSCLRCDSIKTRKVGLSKTLQRNFAYFGDDFRVLLNGEEIRPPDVDYEFVYTGSGVRKADGYAEFNVKVDEEDGDDFEYPIEAWVGFRKRFTSEADGVEKGHLPAKERGARVYCNGRLAAGPTLFDLPTGMHNFHAQCKRCI